MSRYAIHPMEQNFQDWNQEYKERRDYYWNMLRRAWNDFDEDDKTFESFNKFMLSRYGLRVNMVGGNIDSSYQIVDDKKHTMFVLKYG